ncbi:penicillin-binding protein 2B [Bacillaceae bacterium]
MDVKKRISYRALLLALIFTFSFLLLLIRVLWLQTVQADWLMQKAEATWERKEVIEPKRGTIYDRNGEILAYTGKAYNVFARLKPLYEGDENYVRDEEKFATAQKLAPVLNMSVDSLARLMAKDLDQVELRNGGWKIDEKKASRVQALKLPGIGLDETSKRYYPNDDFASHVIGYVNYDGKAEMGIERHFNKELTGEPGRIEFLKDGEGFQLPDGKENYIPAKDGYDVYLTIDKQIQDYLEAALEKAENEFHPEKMTAIVADPRTGEILAMANRPSFNPNEYWNIKNYTNHAIESTFEPGSTFKIVTLAAAVEERLFDPNATYMSGRYTNLPGGDVINDHNNGRGWGRITYLEGVQRSSNVLFVILGKDKLGKERLFRYISAFGFGQPTGIELPREAVGYIRDVNRVYPVEVATTAFGQGVAVTAIQQVMAVGAVANGGDLLQPHIVKEIRDPNTNEVIKRTEPKLIRRVVSQETSRRVRDYLETVVTSEVGTGESFRIEGYQVAGKTGTAQKVGPDGNYLHGKYIFSFIGFAPKNDPRLLVYVVVDSPQIESYQLGGRLVVAPIFKSVMKNSLQYLKVPPQTDAPNVVPDQADEVTLPDVMNKQVTVAKNELSERGLRVEIIGRGNRVIRQYPQAGSKLDEKGTVYLVTQKTNELQVPDFTGRSLREVMEVCSILGLPVKAFGEGYVVKQSIPPGAAVNGANTLVVHLASYPQAGDREEKYPERAESPAHAEE